jgi:hypothetical protein
MNNFIKSLILLFLFTSCGSKTESSQESERAGPKLYIRTTTATGVGEEHVFDSTTVVNSDVFEVTLSVMGEGDSLYYIGTKDLGAEQSDGHLKFFNIVENDSIVRFNGSTEFMKYLSERGYKMVSEKRGEFANDYVFKRE